MPNVKKSDLEGRTICLLGAVDAVSLLAGDVGDVTVLVAHLGDIANPAPSIGAVIIAVTFEWPASQGVAPNGTLFNIQGGSWNSGLDLNDLPSGGGAFLPHDQAPIYAIGTAFTVTYSSGAGSPITPKVSAFGWTA